MDRAGTIVHRMNSHSPEPVRPPSPCGLDEWYASEHRQAEAEARAPEDAPECEDRSGGSLDGGLQSSRMEGGTLRGPLTPEHGEDLVHGTASEVRSTSEQLHTAPENGQQHPLRVEGDEGSDVSETPARACCEKQPQCPARLLDAAQGDDAESPARSSVEEVRAVQVSEQVREEWGTLAPTAPLADGPKDGQLQNPGSCKGATGVGSSESLARADREETGNAEQDMQLEVKRFEEIDNAEQDNRLINRNHVPPINKSQILSMYRDNRPAVKIKILQDSPHAPDTRVLGKSEPADVHEVADVKGTGLTDGATVDNNEVRFKEEHNEETIKGAEKKATDDNKIRKRVDAEDACGGLLQSMRADAEGLSEKLKLQEQAYQEGGGLQQTESVANDASASVSHRQEDVMPSDPVAAAVKPSQKQKKKKKSKSEKKAAKCAADQKKPDGGTESGCIQTPVTEGVSCSRVAAVLAQHAQEEYGSNEFQTAMQKAVGLDFAAVPETQEAAQNFAVEIVRTVQRARSSPSG